METKLCKKCLQDKPYSEYYRDKNTKTGTRTYCKACQLAMKRESRLTNPEKTALDNVRRRASRGSTRWQNIKSKFNLTKEEYFGILEDQQYSCGVCKSTPKKYHVDHDHEKGTVRGLLCPTCNTALGKLGDSKTGVNLALKYLEKEYG